MTTTTNWAAIDADGRVYGIGQTAADALVDGARYEGVGLQHVPISDAAYSEIEVNGWNPGVTCRDGGRIVLIEEVR